MSNELVVGSEYFLDMVFNDHLKAEDKSRVYWELDLDMDFFHQFGYDAFRSRRLILVENIKNDDGQVVAYRFYDDSSSENPHVVISVTDAQTLLEGYKAKFPNDPPILFKVDENFDYTKFAQQMSKPWLNPLAVSGDLDESDTIKFLHWVQYARDALIWKEAQ